MMWMEMTRLQKHMKKQDMMNKNDVDEKSPEPRTKT